MGKQSELVTDLLNRVRNLNDLAGRAVDLVNANPHSVHDCQEFLRRCERLAVNIRSIEDVAGVIRQSDIPPGRKAIIAKELRGLRVTMTLVVIKSIKAHAVVAYEDLSAQRLAQAFGLEEPMADGTGKAR